MMRRALPPSPRAQLCQICETIYARNGLMGRRFFLTAEAGRHRAKSTKQSPSRTITAGVHSTSRTLRRVKQAQPVENPERATDINTSQPSQQQQNHREFADLASIATAVDRVTKAFLGQQGIPSEKTTLGALRACAQNDVKLLLDAATEPEAGINREGQSETAASHLLDLDSNGRRTGGKVATVKQQSSALRLQDVVDKMSEAAYTIITHPPVVITPRILAEYVSVQAQLSKPETLSHILALYASKPLPREVSGSVEYVERNPSKADNAVDADVAEKALDAAIEAKNLDAAVGIIENSYGAKAFVRSKLIKKALVPASVLAAAPVLTYAAASRLSYLQDSMDHGTATGVAFAGLLAYVGFTATIGLVAATTANDQMKRVTWAAGTPLRRRWIREDERAAFDKVACSFGFSEHQRFGEEEGAEFQALRQYTLRKGMILDAVELMEGMN